MFIFGTLLSRRPPAHAALMTGDAEVLDRVARDADRVVLCCCGGAGRVYHVAVNGPGDTEGYVRAEFTCTWDRPGPHGPLLPPRRH
jgi:hypothetical protein